MSYTSHEHKLFYQVEGQGPLVVLLHGLLMSGQSWLQSGLIEVLRERYRVVYPDLLGHGLSEKPSDSGAYALDRQAAGIINMIDELGDHKAHIIGYSSGAWLATGIAKHHPERLSSLVIGGWDIINGLPDGPDGPLSFEVFLAYARKVTPELTASLTEDSILGLRSFFFALGQSQGIDKILAKAAIPTACWAGKDDLYYAPLKNWATANASPFFSGTGDHVTAMLQPDLDTLKEIYGFIQCTENAG